MFSPREICLCVLFLNQNAHWAQPLSGQRQFLNNLDFKQPDAALSPHHRFSHGSRSPTLIYNPQRGFPHPLTPLTAKHIQGLKTHSNDMRRGCVYVCMWRGSRLCWNTFKDFSCEPDCKNFPIIPISFGQILISCFKLFQSCWTGYISTQQTTSYWKISHQNTPNMSPSPELHSIHQRETFS